MRTTVLLAMMPLMLWGCGAGIYSTATICQLPKEEYMAKLRATPNAYLFDVRTRMEYNEDHIAGAQSLSLVGASIDEQIELLDTSRAVFIYCETAHRSPLVTMKLKRVGFTRIYDLKGGFGTLRE
ncbi:MAG: rhodanese-like domain-containing protein [Flavobacteriales bacterium]|nr:rhodanese-like domain-containing protein [Flavobacteriales bacterium]